jgi:hypothetical protein
VSSSGISNEGRGVDLRQQHDARTARAHPQQSETTGAVYVSYLCARAGDLESEAQSYAEGFCIRILELRLSEQ